MAARHQLTPRGAILLLAVAAATLCASPLAAATAFEAHASSTIGAASGATHGGRVAELGGASVHGVADGDRGRIEVREGQPPLAPQGAVILTTDGGKTARLYDSETATCRFWVPAVRASVVSPAIEGLKVEKTIEEAGPAIAGQPTRHYRFVTTYTSAAGGERLSTRRVEDVWTTLSAGDAALRLWLSPAASTGDVDLDARIAAGMKSVTGVALRRTTEVTVTAAKGAPRTVTSHLEVTRYGAASSLPPSTFEPPFDCKVLTPTDRS